MATGGLISLAVAMGIGRFVYAPILPDMIDAFGLTPVEAGLIATANFLGYLLGALAATSDWLGGSRRTWFLSGLFASGFSTAVMGLTDVIELQMVIRLFGGVGSAFVLVFASSLVLDRLGKFDRPGYSSLHFAGVGIGITVSALLVSGLGALGHGWRVQWVSSGVVSLVAAFLVLRLVPRESEWVTPTNGLAGPTADGRLKRLIVACGLFGFGYIITATFISTIARASADGRSLETAVWVIVGLSATPSVALWTYLGRRWTIGRAFSVACVIEAIGVALSVASSDPRAILVGGALLGGTFMGITALGLIYARQLSTGDSRRTLAYMTASFALGQMIGPTFAGVTFAVGDSFLLPSLAAAAALIGSALLVRGRPRVRTAHPTPAA